MVCSTKYRFPFRISPLTYCSRNVSEPLPGERQTNQRAEVMAIIRALEVAPKHIALTIFSDSKYALACAGNWGRQMEANGWRMKKNKRRIDNPRLIGRLRELISERE